MEQNKKLFKGVVVIIIWMVLTTIAMFLHSCSPAPTWNQQQPAETSVSAAMLATQDVKIVDMLEAVASFGNSSISVTYFLLENGDVITTSYGRSVSLPYSKKEAKLIMAFRRGEEVTITGPAK